MAVYLLFGKTGTGKSYIGQLLEDQGVHHLDGDAYITDEMRLALKAGDQITEEMIGAFVDHLAKTINTEIKDQAGRPFVISQAMYLNQYRRQLADKVPSLQFMMIESDETLRMDRIRARFDEGQSKVSPDYALEMDKKFETPDHDFITLHNKGDDEVLIQEVKSLIPNVFPVADDDDKPSHCLCC